MPTSRWSFCPQTQLELRLSASEPLASAEVMTKDEPPQPLAPGEAGSEGNDFRIAWTHEGVANAGAAARLGRQRPGVEALLPDHRSAVDREPRLTLRSAESASGSRRTPASRWPSMRPTILAWPTWRWKSKRPICPGEKPVTTTKRMDLEKFGDGDAALPPAIDRELELQRGRARVGRPATPFGCGHRRPIAVRWAATPARRAGWRFRSSRPTSCSTRS